MTQHGGGVIQLRRPFSKPLKSLAQLFGDGAQLRARFASAIITLYCLSEIALQRFALVPTYPAMTSLWMLAEQLIVALCMLSILLQARRGFPSRVILIAVAVAIFAVSEARTGLSFLLRLLLIVVALDGSDVRSLCRTYAIAASFSIALVVISSVLGALPMESARPNEALVYCYGFTHPNGLGGYLVSVVGAMVFVWWDAPSSFLLAAIAAVCAIFSKVILSSNTSFILLLCQAVIVAVGHRICRRIPNGLLAAIAIIVPMVIASLMLFLTACFDSNNALMLDFSSAVHGRPYYAFSYYVENGGFTLFGRPYATVYGLHTGGPFKYVDCGYSYLSLISGLAVMAVWFILYVRSATMLSRSGIYRHGIVFFLLYSLYMVTETIPLHLDMNFTILLFTCAFGGETSLSGNRQVIPHASDAKI